MLVFAGVVGFVGCAGVVVDVSVVAADTTSTPNSLNLELSAAKVTDNSTRKAQTANEISFFN
jgi:hypothetical protein